MRMVEVIAAKRDGRRLSDDEIAFVVDGFTAGRIPEYQVAAFLMAAFLSGLDDAEAVALTRSMLDSGATLDLRRFGRAVVDKHSTGGIGDKTSLLIAPMAAAAGLTVPMISGRGLAHTTGTLDKLEAIPGFRTGLTLDEFRAQLAQLGVAMIGQTAEIAPADRVLYALRDATATVPSWPLIAASIMSKKLAEGLDALVLDVKTGSGAFMKQRDDARRLARLMCVIGRGNGTTTRALVTNMNQPLGRAIGNGLETVECIEALHGRGPSDLVDLAVELTAWMIALAEGESGVDDRLPQSRATARGHLDSGAALDVFRRVVEAQGGDPRVVDDPSSIPRGSEESVVRADRSGYVARIDAEELGWVGMRLGAGREHLSAPVDHGVGLMMEARLGDDVRAGDVLCRAIGRDATAVAAAARECLAAIVVDDCAPTEEPLVLETIA